MSYRVLIETTAEKSIRSIPREIAVRIVNAVQNLTENPHPHNSLKLIGSERSWRLRVGDYRVLYDIDEENLEVKIWRVRHRKEVYR